VRHHVYKSLYAPLTYFDAWGFPVARNVLWWACGISLGVYVVAHTIIASSGVLLLLCAGGVWSTRRDPQMLTLLLTSQKRHTRYDPAKYEERL
jgi:hypothetical protein